MINSEENFSKNKPKFMNKINKFYAKKDRASS